MSKTLSYTEAIEELEAILAEISSDEIAVDELSSKIKRAAELIRICRSKLYKAEEEVSAVLKEISNMNGETQISTES